MQTTFLNNSPRRNSLRNKRVPKRSPFIVVCIAAVFVLVIVAICIFIFREPEIHQSVSATEGPQPQDGAILPAVADTPAITSTPKDQWQKGSMPYLYQIDTQWADVQYSGGPLSEEGCGPTALTMVYVYLTGNTDYDPAQMAQFSTENGYSTNNNGSSWTLMSEGAAKLGLTSQTLSPTPEVLTEALQQGHPLICVMRPGSFTTVGHYIVIEKIASDGSSVIVHDSNSVGRSMRTWDLTTICNEASNVWSFSLASE